jgi:hypothetical protein
MALAVLSIALAYSLVVASSAFGAVISFSVERMSMDAKAVVVGECISMTARAVNPAAGPRAGIVTDIVVRVDETIAGASAGTVTITQPGGEVDGIGLFVTEVPVFADGGCYVLFLDANTQVIGGSQGALGIVGDRIGSTGEPSLP